MTSDADRRAREIVRVYVEDCGCPFAQTDPWDPSLHSDGDDMAHVALELFPIIATALREARRKALEEHLCADSAMAVCLALPSDCSGTTVPCSRHRLTVEVLRALAAQRAEGGRE